MLHYVLLEFLLLLIVLLEVVILGGPAAVSFHLEVNSVISLEINVCIQGSVLFSCFLVGDKLTGRTVIIF